MNTENTITVVIVDDHGMFCEGLASMLRQDGDFTVLAAVQDGASALECCRATPPDILIADLAMRGMDGLETIRAALAGRLCKAAVLLTMHKHAVIAEDARRAGAAGYIIKDDSAIQINHALLEVLAGHQILSAAATALLMQYVGALAPLHSPTALKQLTEREAEILDLIAQGLTYQQIGEVLTIATSTVQTHIKSIYAKLKVRNKAQAIRTAFGPGQHST